MLGDEFAAELELPHVAWRFPRLIQSRLPRVLVEPPVWNGVLAGMSEVGFQRLACSVLSLNSGKFDCQEPPQANYFGQFVHGECICVRPVLLF